MISAFRRLGFEVDRVSGGHYVLVHRGDPSRRASVPFHGRLKTGTLRAILRETRVALEEFLRVFVIP